MNSQREQQQGWARFARGLLFALVCLLVSTPAAAKGKSAPPQKKDEACLACHGSAGMKSGRGKDIFINPTKHAASAHNVLSCTDCHTDIKDFPHPAKIAKVACAACHSD